jgi:MerR family mercuric resistance operon transcriptional regulator
MSFSIGALARRTGCKAGTIRYYESIDLLPPPPRSEGGHRQYDPEDAKRLNFIRRTRELGFAIEDVRTVLAYVDGGVDGGDVDCDDIRAMTLDQIAEVRRKISDLKKLEKALVSLADDCVTRDGPACPIIESLNG